MPITAPLNTKIVPIARFVAPIDFRIAMSFRFSITTMTSVAAMLNAATRTINSSTMNWMNFSSLKATKRLRFTSIQSRAKYG